MWVVNKFLITTTYWVKPYTAAGVVHSIKLKSVTTTLGLLFSWLHMLHSSYHLREPSLIPKLCTPALCI